MRRLLLWGSENPWLAGRLPRYRFVRRATRRFMPGEDLDSALAEAEGLGKEGARTVLTLLGESLDSPENATAVVDEYLRILDQADRRGLDMQVSVKLTQLGLDLDVEECLANLLRIVERAAESGDLVWIDMEGSGYTDVTLDLFRRVRSAHDNVGLALQAYLHRTTEDLEALLPLDPAIRLVKGAYAEPAEIAFPKKRDVDANFLKLAARMLSHCARTDAGLAVFGTHDSAMIEQCLQTAVTEKLSPPNSSGCWPAGSRFAS
jgi:proline dehydrogenase